MSNKPLTTCWPSEVCAGDARGLCTLFDLQCIQLNACFFFNVLSTRLIIESTKLSRKLKHLPNSSCAVVRVRRTNEIQTDAYKCAPCGCYGYDFYYFPPTKWRRRDCCCHSPRCEPDASNQTRWQVNKRLGSTSKHIGKCFIFLLFTWDTFSRPQSSCRSPKGSNSNPRTTFSYPSSITKFRPRPNQIPRCYDVTLQILIKTAKKKGKKNKYETLIQVNHYIDCTFILTVVSSAI